MLRPDFRRGLSRLRHEVDDADEVAREAVTRAHDGEFAAVQRGGMGKLQVLLREADVVQTAAKGTEVQRLGHGFIAAGRVDHDIGQLAVRDGGERGKVGAVAACGGVRHAHPLTAGRETRLVHVHHDGDGAGGFNELQRIEADGTGANDERSPARRTLSEHNEMTIRRTRNRRNWNAAIKGCQLSAPLHGERQQIDVGQQLRTWNPGWFETLHVT